MDNKFISTKGSFTLKYTLLLISVLFFSNYTKAQTISTIVGNGISGYSGNGGAATLSNISEPMLICFDAFGNLYFSEYGNNVIRKINTSGIITTVAGNDSAGYAGDNGQATNARLNSPTGITIDDSQNIYIADQRNHVIRKVNSVGIISTIAGTGIAGFLGDGGRGDSAQLNNPSDLAIDKRGNLIIGDEYNSAIRKLNLTTGIITTIAGMLDSPGYTGNNGPATNAKIGDVFGIKIDNSGNLFIAESYPQHIIRKIDTNGIISLVAGNDSSTFVGDGMPATATNIAGPGDVAIDDSGNVYFSTQWANVVRKINTAGILSTYAGNYSMGYSGDGGAATSAKLNSPLGLAIDTTGNIYIADAGNYRIRKITTFNLNIASIAREDETKIYPDPSNGIFYIDNFKSADWVNLNVSTLTGTIICSKLIFNNSSLLSLNLTQNVDNGTYLINISDGCISKTFIITINR